MNTVMSYIESDSQVQSSDELQLVLTDEQLALIGGGQCTTNSI